MSDRSDQSDESDRDDREAPERATYWRRCKKLPEGCHSGKPFAGSLSILKE